MTFITTLISLCYQASNWFYDAYTVTSSWILPFRYISGYMFWVSDVFKNMSYAFNDFKTWLIAADSKIRGILNITQITSYFQTWINYAQTAYNWIINAANIILYNVGAWWNTTQQTVKAWVQNSIDIAWYVYSTLLNMLTPIIAGWNSFVSKIPSLNEILLWFTNWWANVLSHLSSWWTQRLIDIKALFNSWILDIETLLKSWVLNLAPFWNGWQEIRNDVYTFFASPLDWLESKFTDWFLGKE